MKNVLRRGIKERSSGVLINTDEEELKHINKKLKFYATIIKCIVRVFLIIAILNIYVLITGKEIDGLSHANILVISTIISFSFSHFLPKVLVVFLSKIDELI
ncbi:hypothetical protein NE686_17500 [Tissierella carlieri]|uniref:Uncharacterized protein n=1 Tax=Tissierella carlieri TaxID=689904 RepID=A0ABT1SEM2_9FIRM|nr:hypothetical protein [Tissierella carlieri]MCQ4924901.1 hypothetical protein [Tissierella carlieri]